MVVIVNQHLCVAADAAVEQQIAARMPGTPSEVPIEANQQPFFLCSCKAASAFGIQPAMQSDQEKREFGWYSCL